MFSSISNKWHFMSKQFSQIRIIVVAYVLPFQMEKPHSIFAKCCCSSNMMLFEVLNSKQLSHSLKTERKKNTSNNIESIINGTNLCECQYICYGSGGSATNYKVIIVSSSCSFFVCGSFVFAVRDLIPPSTHRHRLYGSAVDAASKCS